MSRQHRRSLPTRRPGIEGLEGRALMAAAITFGGPTISAPQLNPTGALAVGDFNRDGRPDLVVGSQPDADAITPNPAPGLYVLEGMGDGAFRQGDFIPLDFHPYAIVTGDFNHDGKLDLAVAGSAFGTDAGPHGVEILLGNGRGGFRRAGDFAAGPDPVALVAGDFNGDGKTDLAVSSPGVSDGHANDNAFGSVDILMGLGNGTFRAPRAYFAGIGPGNLVAGDLTGDGRTDLAVVDSPSSFDPSTSPLAKRAGFSILPGRGDGTFQPPIFYATAGSPTQVAIGDLNGDGRPDLAIGVAGDPNGLAGGGPGHVEFRLNLGRGAFGTPTRYGLDGNPEGLALADLNDDGHLDLLAATSLAVTNFVYEGGLDALAGDGRGRFGERASSIGYSTPFALALADLNGDGKPDAITIENLFDLEAVPINQQSVYARLNTTKAR